MSLEQQFERIMEEFKVFSEQHEVFVEKANKSAEARARKALGEIKKLVTPYRQTSVKETSKK